MIHRRFLGLSFHDNRFAFTRRTCLAAAKTIINEMKEAAQTEYPNMWVSTSNGAFLYVFTASENKPYAPDQVVRLEVKELPIIRYAFPGAKSGHHFEQLTDQRFSKTTQAFSVAAAVILSLDNFNRNQSAREYAEHRKLISQTIDYLSAGAQISSIASRGSRLLTDLLAEERNMNLQNGDGLHLSQRGKQRAIEGSVQMKPSERSLNVAAFVKKFCESDQPQTGNSPIATSHMPLWLQQDSSIPLPGHQGAGGYSVGGDNTPYSAFQQNSSQLPYDNMVEPGYQVPPTARRHQESFATMFGQNFDPPFDVSSLNWFDDLLGLAPSHSI